MRNANIFSARRLALAIVIGLAASACGSDEPANNRTAGGGAAGTGGTTGTDGGDAAVIPTGDKMDPSQTPPGGLAANQVPKFVAVGCDDNGYAGATDDTGITFVHGLMTGRKNHDGSSAHMSYYVIGDHVTANSSGDPGPDIVAAMKAVIADGHEVGVHSYDHADSLQTNVATNSIQVWTDEVEKGLSALETGLGLTKSQLNTWRTPFLSYNDNLFTVLAQEGFLYDCTIEEGAEDGSDGTNFYWPYTLDNGSPGNTAEQSWGPPDAPALVTSHPGLWELPSDWFFVPPDSDCTKYGYDCPSDAGGADAGGTLGLREKLHALQDYFDPSVPAISGLDWNLWIEFQMTPQEFIGTIEYSFDQHMKGNRAPFPLGIHADIYSPKYDVEQLGGGDKFNPASTPDARKAALTTVIEYMASQGATFVSGRELIAWMKAPTPAP